MVSDACMMWLPCMARSCILLFVIYTVIYGVWDWPETNLSLRVSPAHLFPAFLYMPDLILQAYAAHQ